MKREEEETNITYDYFRGLIWIYTTRASVYNGYCHRLGPENVTLQSCSGHDWRFTVSMELCRTPQMLAKVINPEAKGPAMPDALKEAYASMG